MRRRTAHLAALLMAGLFGGFVPPVAAQVVISEIMYHPLSDEDGDEFVELLLPASEPAPVDLEGYCLDGIEFCFPAGATIAPGQFLVLASDAARFQTTYGIPPDYVYALRLDDNGERLVLLGDTGSVVDEVSYADRGQWPVTPDGLGPSLEVIDPAEDNNTPRNWRASTAPAGHTVGGANSVAATGLPPWIDDVQHPVDLQPNDPVIVTADVDAATTVELSYRIDFGTETSVAMLDDGNSGDGAAGDGVYGATIPGQPAGTLVRYRIGATGPTGAMEFPRDDDTVEYGGTAVLDPGLSTLLPVVHWFMDPGSCSEESDNAGATCSNDSHCPGGECDGYAAALSHKFTNQTEPAVIFYDGRLYDGVQARIRGQSARSWPKPPWKFYFPQGHNFEAPGLIERPVDTFNLQSSYSDKSYVRETLAWESTRASGMPYLQAFPLRVHQNGQFFGLYTYVEAADADWIERNRLDRQGALYKASDDARPRNLGQIPSFYEKQTRLTEDYSDLVAFLAGINDPDPAARRAYLFDNLNIPEAINYIAAMTILHNNDHVRKNYFLYRDTEGTQRWSVLAWDLDLTFGRNFFNGSLNDVIWADVDSLEGEPSVAPSHPLFGDSLHQKIGGAWNRLINQIHADDEIRQMYFRRLRSLMDLLLPQGEYEKRIDELVGVTSAEAAQDPLVWGQYGTPQTQAEAVTILKNDYLAPRRVHLFNTHSICDIPGPQAPLPRIVINEIMYHPSGGPGDEFIELYNPSSTDAVDVSGWRLDGVALTLPAGTVILPGSFTLLVENDVQFRATYGGGKFVAAQYAGSLSDVGEPLVLRNPSGEVVSSVNFEALQPWPPAAAGGGASLELIDASRPTGRVANWAASSTAGGTPGAANSAAGAIDALPDLWINEVLSDNVSTNVDEMSDFDPWIEIYNASADDIDLGGMSLSADYATPGQWVFPTPTLLCGGCWKLVWVDGEPGEGPLHASFSLNPLGGSIGLFEADGSLIDYANHDALPADVSRGRFPDGEADIRNMVTVTPQAANQVPASPLVLNEYNAVSPENFLKNSNSDSYWGRVLGNGGDWFELVVTQDHLDIRDWELEMRNDSGGAGETVQSLFFSASSLWADLRSGTILTISEDLPTDTSYFPPAGDWWINAQGSFETSNLNWQLTIKDALGQTVYGPAGEGIQPLSGVGNDEVFKLEEDPGLYLSPTTAEYNDGTSSTFGSPNRFGGGLQEQDFSTLRATGLTGNCTPDSDGDGICDAEDNCPSLSNPSQSDVDGDDVGDKCDTCKLDPDNDIDVDGTCGDQDNCPFVANPAQADGDADGVGDVCDNCPAVSNPTQTDTNGDGLGDACDPCPLDPLSDIDGDGVCGDVDNCPYVANAGQENLDGDAHGDACDVCPADAQDDLDLDGYCADVDNCPQTTNPTQDDLDADGVGDFCDNCAGDANPTQDDLDDDGQGDVCDGDDDGDGVADGADNCPQIANPDQADNNGNGQGDACDGDDDDDGVLDAVDNCRTVANASQVDGDLDGFGDDCDCSVGLSSVAAVPGQLGASLQLSRDAGTTLRWTRAQQGHVSNVYRGTFTIGQPWSYDEGCFVASTAGREASDTEVPAPGSGFYYLVSGENSCGEGPAGLARPAGDHYPASVCPPSAGDGDGDGVADASDNCAQDSNASQLDDDGDFVGNTCDNCPLDANPYQENLDADGSGDACDADDDGDGVDDVADNCPTAANAGQQDADGDGLGDACDTCTDFDGDGLGDPGYAVRTCALDPYPTDPENDADDDGLTSLSDNCPLDFNPDQSDGDGDTLGDPCDPCPGDAENDVDDDGICAGVCGPIEVALELANIAEVELVAAGSPMTYLYNVADPGIDMGWTQPGFDDSGWSQGTYGVGYEATQGAENLIQTPVPVGTLSVFTRTSFDIADVAAVTDLFAGADYDDAFVMWINGVEVYRSPEMPTTVPAWNTAPASHESSNGTQPDYAPMVDISAVGIPLLTNGSNLLAVAVWNRVPFAPPSEDLLLVPRLSINRTSTMRYLANAADPGLSLDWVAEAFDDSAWPEGTYGVGYETEFGAAALIDTSVPPDSLSVYTRAAFVIDDVGKIDGMRLGADYDDGVVAWINGTEVYRFEEMPAGDPDWDTLANSHESSNGYVPDFNPPVDITTTALPVIRNGLNHLAIGVWNAEPGSSDLVLVPQLSVYGQEADNCASINNPTQADADLDGVGDACDNCATDFNAHQTDADGDGLGNVCDNCPFIPNLNQSDVDLDGVGDFCDNCPSDPNPSQTDTDGNGLGDACDAPLPMEMEPNDDCSIANPVTLGGTVLASLSSSEYDYFSVTLTADAVLTIETAGDPFGDTVVGVFDSLGTQLYGCDDDNSTPSDYYSLFSCCLPPGDYCIGVKGYNADPIANYSIDFIDAATCTADPDPAMNGCSIENTYGACVPF